MLVSESLKKSCWNGCLLQFPFYCKDREYIIGRRIWESNNTYYCITQVVLLSVAFLVLIFFLLWCRELSGLQYALFILSTGYLRTLKYIYVLWQGVHYPSVPRQKSPLRVDVYFSSWSIRAGRIWENILTAYLCFHPKPVTLYLEMSLKATRALKDIYTSLCIYESCVCLTIYC